MDECLQLRLSVPPVGFDALNAGALSSEHAEVFASLAVFALPGSACSARPAERYRAA